MGRFVKNEQQCVWCMDTNGCTDFDFGVIDDDIGMRVPERFIKYCPFCGRKIDDDASRSSE